MCGGSSDKAQKEATADDAKKQAQITAAQQGITSIFDDPSRQAQYDKLAADTTQFYTNDVNEKNAVAQRKLKFALGRSGLAGGSQQIYQGTQLGKDYSKAIVGATRAGNEAASNLRSSDEQLRSQLQSEVTAGLDSGTANQQATEGLRSNLLSGESTATANNLSDSFGDFASLYQQSADAKAARAGQVFGYGSIFSPLYGSGSQGVGT